MSINYYTEYWNCTNEDRNLEVINCINSNIESNLFDNIIIFSSIDEPRLKIKTTKSERITYQKIFNLSNFGINILANADILFNNTINLVNTITEKDFLAITRYEDNDRHHKYDDYYNGSDSQDVWIWKDICKIQHANFYLGLPGCDNKIAYLAEQYGYNLKNPSLSVITKHMHKTNNRSGSSSDLSKRIPPPYKLVPVSTI